MDSNSWQGHLSRYYSSLLKSILISMVIHGIVWWWGIVSHMASEKIPTPLGSEEYSLNVFLEASIVGFEVNVYNPLWWSQGADIPRFFNAPLLRHLSFFNLSSFICSFQISLQKGWFVYLFYEPKIRSVVLGFEVCRWLLNFVLLLTFGEFS